MSCSRSLSLFVTVALSAVVLVGCTDDPEPVATTVPTAEGEAPCRPDRLPDAVTPDAVAAADVDGSTITLATHDSFATSDGIFDRFTEETGVEVEVLQVGDAGTLVSQSILTAGEPVADVLFGIDTTFLCRGTRAGLFTPYAPVALADVDDALEQDPDHLVTPIAVGDVGLNDSRSASPDPDDAPRGLDDLADERFAEQFVTQNPESSSPGLAFLLATIAEYGPDGWQDYWERLRDNGLEVTSGWEEAYNEAFGAGSGDRTVVTSYATSPVADVLYSDPPRTEPAIGVVTDACFRQVEFAGILRGSSNPEAAALLVDFLLSPAFQEDIPLNMFVEPVNRQAEIRAEFKANRVQVDEPLTMSPAEIEAGRDAWTETWTRIVLR